MKQETKTGQVDYTVLIFIPDSASSDGSGKTGLVAADLTAGYTRVETDNDVVHVDGTSSLNNLASLTAAHADWGLLEVSSSLAPGLYRLDLPDGVFASGAWSAVVYVMVTTSAAAASPMEFVLIPQAPVDGVLLAPTTHTSAVIPTVTTLTGHTPQTGDNFARLGAPAGASVSADIAAIEAQTDDIGVAGAGLTALGDTRIANLDATVSSRASQASVDTIDDFLDTEVAAILAAVDTEIAAIKTKTDFLPSATAGDAGGLFIAGSNAATTFSTLTVTGAMTLTGTTTFAAIAATTITTIGAVTFASFVTNLTGNVSGSVGSVTGNVGGIAGTTTTLDALQTALNSAHGSGSWATATGFSTHSASDVWAVATRVLTAGTNIVLAKGVGVTGFNDLSAAAVNAEVVDALNVDTYAEVGQEAPAATTTLRKMIAYLYKTFRNKKTQTATQFSLFADDGTTVDQKATVSDDTTTTTIGELGTGP